MSKYLLWLVAEILLCGSAHAVERKKLNFNAQWMLCVGDAPDAKTTDYDDSRWEVVTTPHSVELESPEVSGCRNYQGVAWYRKRFVVPTEMEGRRCSLHFEAVMGRQVVYVNGREALRHWGGFLPFTIDLTAAGVEAGDTCIIALMADNSDDASYPPGKPQYALDFTYHGGIYRDVWLIAWRCLPLRIATRHAPSRSLAGAHRLGPGRYEQPI